MRFHAAAPSSSALFMRGVTQVYIFLIGSHAYRPDGDNDQQLTVIPRGGLQHLAKTATQNDTQAVLVQNSLPSALQQSWANSRVDRSGPSPPPKHAAPEGHEKCAGAGDLWKCAWVTGDGQACDAGGKCKVKCNDPYNFHPKTGTMLKGVVCKDGKYDEEPECIQNVQCDNGGGGWKCKGVKYDKLNEGMICHVECAEPDFRALVEKATCKDGKFEPEAGCEQKKHCLANGGAGNDGWTCEGHMEGRQEVPSGQSCKLTCTDKKMVPSHDSVACDDGHYPESPSCGPKAAQKSLAVLRWSPTSCCVPLTLMLMVVLCKLDLDPTA